MGAQRMRNSASPYHLSQLIGFRKKRVDFIPRQIFDYLIMREFQIRDPF